MNILKIQLTTNNIKTLNSNPIEVVPAPGINKSYMVHNMYVVYTYNTIPFDNPIIISATTNLIDGICAVRLESTSIEITASAIAAGAPTLSNTSLFLKSDGDSVNGDSTADVYIIYSIIDL